MNNYSRFLLFFALLNLSVNWLTSCTPATKASPNDLIPEEKFVDVLVDVRLLEASYGVRVGRPDTIGKYMDSHYKLLFDKHGVAKNQFYSSYEYYLSAHEKMLLMEDKVLEKLTLLQADLDKRIPNEMRLKSDSLDKKITTDSLTEKKPL